MSVLAKVKGKTLAPGLSRFEIKILILSCVDCASFFYYMFCPQWQTKLLSGILCQVSLVLFRGLNYLCYDHNFPRVTGKGFFFPALRKFIFYLYLITGFIQSPGGIAVCGLHIVLCLFSSERYRRSLPLIHTRKS